MGYCGGGGGVGFHSLMIFILHLIIYFVYLLFLSVVMCDLCLTGNMLKSTINPMEGTQKYNITDGFIDVQGF